MWKVHCDACVFCFWLVIYRGVGSTSLRLHSGSVGSVIRVGELSIVCWWVVLNADLLFKRFKGWVWEFKLSLKHWFKLGSKYGFKLLFRLCFNERFCALVLNYMLLTVLCMVISMFYTVFDHLWWWLRHWWMIHVKYGLYLF